jgi:hypothetical protein
MLVISMHDLEPTGIGHYSWYIPNPLEQHAPDGQASIPVIRPIIPFAYILLPDHHKDAQVWNKELPLVAPLCRYREILFRMGALALQSMSEMERQSVRGAQCEIPQHSLQARGEPVIYISRRAKHQPHMQNFSQGCRDSPRNFLRNCDAHHNLRRQLSISRGKEGWALK